MLAESFERALTASCRRTPFEPFTVELSSGGRIEVKHPEALVFRGGIAVHFGADGELTIFDHHGLTRFIGVLPQSTQA